MSLFDNEKMAIAQKRNYFTSNAFLSEMTRLVRIYARNPKINIEKSETTGTDGKTLFVNLNVKAYLSEELSKTMTTLCYLADAFHENGHLEESCFEIVWAINSKKWDASFLSTKERRLVEKYVGSYTKNLSAYKRHALADLNNIVEDSAMEYRQGKKHGPFVAKCFKISNVVIMNNRPTLEEVAKEHSKYDVLVEAILCYSVIHYTKGSIENDELRELFEIKLMPLCKKGMYAETPIERFLVAREMFEYLLPYLDEKEENDKEYENRAKSNQSKPDDGKSGNQQNQRSMPNMEDEPNTSNENNDENQSSSNNSSDGNKNEKSKSQSSGDGNSDKNSSDYSMDNFDGIIEELSEENKQNFDEQVKQGLRNVDAKLDIEHQDKMKSLEEQLSFTSTKPMKGSSCIDATIKVDASCPTTMNETKYLKVVSENQALIDTFTSYFAELLRVRPKRVVNSQYGSRLSQRTLPQYRFNPMLYEEVIPQKNIPPFNVVVLMDASGSMRHTENDSSRIDKATEAVIILNEVFHNLGIKYAVISHGASYPKVKMKCYKNYDSCYDERFKIASIEVDHNCGNNRDGYAIRFIESFVQEKGGNTIVLSLSDGQPNDSGYTGAAAIADTKKAVESLSLQAKVIGVCITNENGVENAIKSIYKNNIVVGDLSELPARLMNELA